MKLLVSTILAGLLASGLQQNGDASSVKRQSEPPSATTHELLQRAQSWTYQLQGDMRAMADHPSAVAVVDMTHMQFYGGPNYLRRGERAPATGKGRRRLILSYLSIGEAESSRPYWRRCCNAKRRPAWIAGGSPRWRGNFRVRFWDKKWKAIIVAQLKQIIASGYDGVYLDRIDVWETLASERKTARADMIAFVEELSVLGRKIKSDFIIVVQNAEELLANERYLAAIDAVGKEDLLYGIQHSFKRNTRGDIAASVALLRKAQAHGKVVFVVEYLRSATLIASARRELVALGFVPLVATRGLHLLLKDQLLRAR